MYSPDTLAAFITYLGICGITLGIVAIAIWRYDNTHK